MMNAVMQRPMFRPQISKCWRRFFRIKSGGKFYHLILWVTGERKMALTKIGDPRKI